MKHLRPFTWAVLSLLLFAPVAAVVLGDVCPEVVRSALEATDRLCENTGRNQACYGHILLEAQPQPGLSSFAFDQAGDVVDVAAVQSLRLWPMEPDTGVWGVALMRLQADLPTAENANVTLLTFGDVQIENAAPPPTETDVTAAVDSFINVRRLPSTQAGVVGALAPGQTVKAVERLADNSWIRIELPDSGVFGWVYTPLLEFEGDLNTLNVVESRMPHYRPMQAFYFNSGINDPACAATPTSGMLIQTPEGVGEVSFLINEVNIRIGSTVFFQAQAGEQMTITTVEGYATVTASGVTQSAPAGTELSVPLTEDLTPAGPPSRPQPYNETELQSLPISVLDREIEIAPALPQQAIDQIYAPPAGCRCDAAAGVSEDGNNCPGQSCQAPGQGGNCPGNSCAHPGNANENAGSRNENAAEGRGGNANGRGNR